MLGGAATPLHAQAQPRKQVTPPLGPPPEFAASPLRPHPAPLTAKPAHEIPLDRIKLPPGFQISLWAEGLPNARSITLGSKGLVFVSSRVAGNVYAVVDKGDRREVKIIAKGLHRPNGVAFRGGALYVAELSRILRFDNIEDRLDNPPAPVVIFDRLPKDEPHGWKFLAIGPDGKLYFNVGAPCNICEPPPTHALIARINLDGTGYEVFARGVRQSVGFDWHPVTRELWFTDNGRDWLGDDVPSDELNHAPRPGMHFGYPYCHQGDLPDPEFGRNRSCGEFTPPVVKLGPHVAGLGMRFYTGDMFPPEYRNRIIIAQRGSWNRTKKLGYRLMQVDLSGGRPRYEVFAEGWLQGEAFWGRPVDVQVMPDGALLVSDDNAGALYRITYKR
ncbi:MAG: sorbosone dehydrogenase family protein [Deltaproteobacteria bacterium]|nr:sorbosone dehydrogenase family protein [Deltaproteobacteria bacterium]MBI3077988.1 sorbosone dehydrogenase family protein [Deltaproteobacteria bacterium]